MECDAQIHYEAVYEGDELQRAFTEEHIYGGGGGTDFCPVFERIAEYEVLGGTVIGLLYYSDGEGQFPEKAPGYPCYFIQPIGDFYDPHMPEWVARVSL